MSPESSPSQLSRPRAKSSRLRAVLDVAATILLVGCAVAVTASTLIRNRRSSSATRAEFEKISDGERFHAGPGWIGDSAADVRITVFSDFQCPFCARLAGTLDSIVQDFPEGVAWRYRHFPLTVLHSDAFAAAAAAECARDQGRFKSFHDLLFSRQASIGVTGWVEFAAQAGVTDIAQFDQCVAEGRHDNAVRSDSAMAAELRVGGTPTVVVNDWRYGGAPTRAQLSELIARELRRAQ